MADAISRSKKALLQSLVIDNGDGTYTLDLDGTGGTRPKVIDNSKEFIRKLTRENGDGTRRLETNLNTNNDDIIAYINSRDAEIRFREGDFGPPGGVTTATATIHVVDGVGVANPFTTVPSVTVTDAGGSASGKTIVTPQPVSFVTTSNPRTTIATVQVSVSGTGTFILGLSDSAGTGLTVSDTLTITFT